MIRSQDRPQYSEKYYDDLYEYRQVTLPREWVANIKDKKLLSEEEWRALGVTQSRGWTHYDYHKPEPHILLFRRPRGTDPRTGEVDERIRQRISDREKREMDILKRIGAMTTTEAVPRVEGTTASS